MEGISELKTELSGTRIEKIKFIKHLINENNDKINKTIKKVISILFTEKHNI